jgi:HK97 family phage portal protein
VRWPWSQPRQEIIDPEVVKGQRLSLTEGAAWRFLFGGESNAGKTVNLKSTLQLATAWACIRLTATAVSSLPAGMFEKGANDSRKSIDHDLSAVLFDSPNAGQTGLEFWETMVANLVARGNAYAERVQTGRFLSALQPVDARPVRVNGVLMFRVYDRGKTEDLPADKVFHLKGFSLGQDEGLSPITCGVHGLGSAIADETAARIFANGLQQPLFIDSGQNKLTQDQRADLTKLFKGFQGSDNTGKVMVLEQGMKPVPLTLSPDDAQMLASRRFNVEEICRWFGTPPIIVGHAAEGQTMWGSGVEQIMLAWLALGINPLCKRIEARIKKDLIPVGERRRVYAEFNREGLLQMDSAAKAAFLSTLTQNGLMDRNEGRAKLNLSAREGADVLTAQTNLAPLTQLGGGNTDVAAQMRALLGIKDQTQ